MKKFCEKCGLRHDFGERERTDQFVCRECGHVNISKTMKTMEKKLAKFDACPHCGMVAKGKATRKKDGITTMIYACSNCGKEWKERWVKTTLKERLRDAVKKP